MSFLLFRLTVTTSIYVLSSSNGRRSCWFTRTVSCDLGKTLFLRVSAAVVARRLRFCTVLNVALPFNLFFSLQTTFFAFNCCFFGRRYAETSASESTVSLPRLVFIVHLCSLCCSRLPVRCRLWPRRAVRWLASCCAKTLATRTKHTRTQRTPKQKSKHKCKRANLRENLTLQLVLALFLAEISTVCRWSLAFLSTNTRNNNNSISNRNKSRCFLAVLARHRAHRLALLVARAHTMTMTTTTTMTMPTMKMCCRWTRLSRQTRTAAHIQAHTHAHMYILGLSLRRMTMTYTANGALRDV